MRVLLAMLFLAAAAPPLHAQALPVQKLDRVDLLAAWLDAVDRHRPGFADDSIHRVASWGNRELTVVREHYPTLVSLIRQPGLALFFRRVRGTTRTRQLFYAGGELRRLGALAARYGAAPGALCAGAGAEGFNGATDLLKRVAVFHLDLTMVPAAAAPQPRTDTESAFTVNVDDGQSTGMFGAAGHLGLARDALDAVTRPCSTRPEPARDAWVRDWYATSLASQLTQEQFEVAHVSRALELFPDDPDILTLSGAVHEVLAGPRFQLAIGDDRVVRDRLGIRSAAGELGRAEDLLRRATRRDARSAEARLRLGNVLGHRGRHAEAARELAQAVELAGEDRLAAYYARLLHGRELEALGQRDAARRAYEQAGRLFPAAHAPRLASSQLQRASGDAAAAVAMLDGLVRPAGDDVEDPWWTYHRAAGRDVERRMRALAATTPAMVAR